MHKLILSDDSMTTEVETNKRQAEESCAPSEAKKARTEPLDALASAANSDVVPVDPSAKRAPMSKARENRLEQNRKAARESRRRKKLMIEELQRSVIFFSKANGTLKVQNDELARRLMDAQSRVASVEGNKDAAPVVEAQQAKVEESKTPETPTFINEQAAAQAVATQAMYESQGFPAGAARAAAQAMNASTPSQSAEQGAGPGAPQMQPGATMQAMAAFQQAAAAAMQAAMGMNPTAPQQAYADAMNAFAQQAPNQFMWMQQQPQWPKQPEHQVPMQQQQQQEQTI